ncbi:NAD-dependent epimerase/dehydratase family protein [Ferrovibrio sp.]|uniref:NAD-dependent epimerase/dehydratase family protein n=1 Tax=Ferrovibrio sp. TaxID=1917215 RepID=UPI0035AF1895
MRKFDNVIVVGGAGYCGSLLVPQLLKEGYRVRVYDTMFFGDYLPHGDPNLTVIKGDIRDIQALERAMDGVEAVIQLACISNDASFELDEALSTTINLDAFEPMVVAAKRVGVKRFIFASSSSVYGVSDSPDVREDHPLVPLTLYNKYKGMCEPLLFKHTDATFVGVAFRPATVCGYAPRQRMDLSVNILTNHAVNNNKITVFGGEQLRPNLHVQDYVDLCKMLLVAPDEKIANEVFNCGYQNMSIMDLAHVVKKVVLEEFPEKKDIEIVTTPTNDIRSYHINSDKIANTLNFRPTHSIEDAVRDLCKAMKAGKLPSSMTDDRYFNVTRLKNLKAK